MVNIHFNDTISSESRKGLHGLPVFHCLLGDSDGFIVVIILHCRFQWDRTAVKTHFLNESRQKARAGIERTGRHANRRRQRIYSTH